MRAHCRRYRTRLLRASGPARALVRCAASTSRSDSMQEITSALVVFVVLLVGTAIGWFVKPLLPEEHRAHETVQLIQLVIGMLVTFAALVLGLLTASAKNSFDTVNNDFRAYASQLIQLD